jgi:uncharacterized protein DUF3347
MKTKQILLSILFGASAFLINCSGNKKEDSTTHLQNDANTEPTEAVAEDEKPMQPQFNVDAEFQQQLASVFSSYVSLKNAFVSSDVNQVKAQASATGTTVNKVDMKLLSGAAHNDWITYLSPIQSALKAIEATNDIEVQRKAFSTLSDNLYKSIKAFGLGGKEAFYEFCPMAFNNDGAYWLSDKEQIRNPYFGDKMLTCGEVKEKLN